MYKELEEKMVIGHVYAVCLIDLGGASGLIPFVVLKFMTVYAYIYIYD